MTTQGLKQPFFALEKYRWETSKSNPRTLQRRGNGAEAIVGLKDSNSIGQYDLYITTSLTILPTAPLSNLRETREKIQATLLDLRFKHPDIACTVTWDENTQTPPLIQYTPPENQQDALTWAQELIHVRATPQTGLEVRTEIEERRRLVISKRDGKLPSKPFVAYVIADVPNESSLLAPGTVVEILLHMNHLHWDGISARTFAGDLVRGLGRKSGTEPAQYDWGKETPNLSVPILDTMTLDLNSLGDDFAAAHDEYLKLLYSSADSWGLKPKAEPGTPRTLFYTFSASESESMIRAVKSRLGPGYTLSHLGHAAFVLSILEMNPTFESTPDDKALVMTFPINGRRWLKEKYAKEYYTLCQSGAVITLENVKSYVVDDNDKDAVVRTLEKASKSLKTSYDYWINKPFQLALGVSKDVFIASNLSSDLVPVGDMTVPMFISDGINDRFVPHDIIDEGTGEKLMCVDNFAFFLDQYLPFIAIRMDSWKGATTLSLCYSDRSHTFEEATTFLDNIAKYMLAFI